MCGVRTKRKHAAYVCVQRARARAMGGVGGRSGRGRRRRAGWPGQKAAAVPWRSVPSSAVPVSAVPASTTRMRSAAATSPAAGGPQHLPSEGRNEPWEAGAGHARGGSARRRRTSLKLWSKSLRVRTKSPPQLDSPAARAQARSVLPQAGTQSRACLRHHHGMHARRRQHPRSGGQGAGSRGECTWLLVTNAQSAGARARPAWPAHLAEERAHPKPAEAEHRERAARRSARARASGDGRGVAEPHLGPLREIDGAPSRGVRTAGGFGEA